MSGIARPEADEYNEYYAGYVGLVPEGDVLATLDRQLDELVGLVGNLSDEEALSRFAPGEWTIKQVVGHLVDGERAFGYRAFAFSRGESAALPSFDQDEYVRQGAFDGRALGEMIEELTHLRRANLIAFRALSAEAIGRRGVASNNPVSVRALIYITAGHLQYHIIDLREKYLPALRA